MDFKVISETGDKKVFRDIFEPDCPFANECSGKGLKCNSCKHNKSKKKDYYESDIPPYIWKGPYYPPTVSPSWKSNDIILCRIN